MHRSIVALLVILVCAATTYGQETQKRVKRPDLPGAFIIEFGFNRAQGSTPNNFEQGLWGSRTLNLYYAYPIRLWNSKFSYRPTFGLSLERYKLTNNYTLSRFPDGTGTYQLVPASGAELNLPGTDKSMFIMNYIELMPAEIQFDTKPDDPNRSVHISAGVRVGFLFDTHTKVNYSINNESATYKDSQSHGVNSFRYALYSRLGVGSFSLFGYYNVTPVFQADKGPDRTQMNTLTIGISLSGF